MHMLLYMFLTKSHVFLGPAPLASVSLTIPNDMAGTDVILNIVFPETIAVERVSRLEVSTKVITGDSITYNYTIPGKLTVISCICYRLFSYQCLEGCRKGLVQAVKIYIK